MLIKEQLWRKHFEVFENVSYFSTPILTLCGWTLKQFQFCKNCFRYSALSMKVQVTESSSISNIMGNISIMPYSEFSCPCMLLICRLSLTCPFSWVDFLPPTPLFLLGIHNISKNCNSRHIKTNVYVSDPVTYFLRPDLCKFILVTECRLSRR